MLLLGIYGKYICYFAQNHNIDINAAVEKPMVKAYQEYLTKIELNDAILYQSQKLQRL